MTIAGNSSITWNRGAAQGVAVRRAADSQLARIQMQAQAAADGTPSAVVQLGRDVALISGDALRTVSRVARSENGLAAGAKVNVDGQEGTVLLTDDGFREIDARRAVVAVIDTGVDVNHPALRGRLLPGYNAADGSRDVTDRDGHGTHVAGIIAGSWDTDASAAGVAPQASVLPIKAADAAGNFSDESISRGVRYAVQNGARVINLSLRGNDPLPQTSAAIAEARRAGVLVVAASGNDGQNRVTYPGAYEGVLAVGSSVNGRRSSFSNGGDRLDMTAPGENVRSTQNGSYGERSGTSMSSPYVAAAAALVMARNPQWTAEQVKAQLLNTATDFGARGKDADFGYGEIDLYAAVFGAGQTPGAAPAPAPGYPAYPSQPAYPTYPQQPSIWDRLRGLFGGNRGGAGNWNVGLFA
jgi:subtilisin family serine protease